MHIGVDGGSWGNPRGYGRFLTEILDALARVDSGNQYTLFLDSSSTPAFQLSGTIRSVTVETTTSPARRSLRDALRLRRAVGRESPDLLFFPSVYSFFPVAKRIPLVLCIHDTIIERDPTAHFGSSPMAAVWRAKLRFALARARTVVTVSEYSRRSISELLRVRPERTRVVYEAASPRFRQMDAGSPLEPFVMYVGGFGVHKNLRVLARAYARTNARKSGVKLLFVGDYLSDPFVGAYQQLREEVARLGLEPDVNFTGFVPDEELCVLYNQAAVVVLPSLDEGFGLPALEAMACGVPVIASKGHALEEVVGDAGLLVDPHDETDLAAAMDRVLADRELAREMVRKSLARAAGFSWDRTASEFVAIFRQALQTEENRNNG